jgi:hypothetical protein
MDMRMAKAAVIRKGCSEASVTEASPVRLGISSTTQRKTPVSSVSTRAAWCVALSSILGARRARVLLFFASESPPEKLIFFKKKIYIYILV